MGVTQGRTRLKRFSIQYCSSQHHILLPSPVTSTTGYCFCFGSISSFFLELFLHSSPVAYWAPTNLGSSSFSVLSICVFILFMGFSRQEYWSGLPCPSPVDHILSELFIMTRPSWVALHRMAHSFIESEVSLNQKYAHIYTVWWGGRWRGRPKGKEFLFKFPLSCHKLWLLFYDGETK